MPIADPGTPKGPPVEDGTRIPESFCYRPYFVHLSIWEPSDLILSTIAKKSPCRGLEIDFWQNTNNHVEVSFDGMFLIS